MDLSDRSHIVDAPTAGAFTPTSAEVVPGGADWMAAHWMPFTGNRQFKVDPRLVAAEGAYLIDADGRLPSMVWSGLWCTAWPWPARDRRGRQPPGRDAGLFARVPVWPSAVVRAGQPHRRAHSRAGLNRVFFTGSGSESADTSLKMARAYWRAKGQASKTRLIGRAKGYHGVNFGGISVGGIVGNRKLFGQGVEADHLPHTQPPAGGFYRGCAPRRMPPMPSIWPTICWT